MTSTPSWGATRGYGPGPSTPSRLTWIGWPQKEQSSSMRSQRAGVRTGTFRDHDTLLSHGHRNHAHAHPKRSLRRKSVFCPNTSGLPASTQRTTFSPTSRSTCHPRCSMTVHLLPIGGTGPPPAHLSSRLFTGSRPTNRRSTSITMPSSPPPRTFRLKPATRKLEYRFPLTTRTPLFFAGLWPGTAT